MKALKGASALEKYIASTYVQQTRKVSCEEHSDRNKYQPDNVGIAGTLSLHEVGRTPTRAIVPPCSPKTSVDDSTV